MNRSPITVIVAVLIIAASMAFFSGGTSFHRR